MNCDILAQSDVGFIVGRNLNAKSEQEGNAVMSI